MMSGPDQTFHHAADFGSSEVDPVTRARMMSAAYPGGFSHASGGSGGGVAAAGMPQRHFSSVPPSYEELAYQQAYLHSLMAQQTHFRQLSATPERDPLPTYLPREKSQLSKEDVSKYFYLPLTEAATRLNLSCTLLKRVCRKYKIKRWPYRKIHSLEKRLESIRSRMPPMHYPTDCLRNNGSVLLPNGMGALQFCSKAFLAVLQRLQSLCDERGATVLYAHLYEKLKHIVRTLRKHELLAFYPDIQAKEKDIIERAKMYGGDADHSVDSDSEDDDEEEKVPVAESLPKTSSTESVESTVKTEGDAVVVGVKAEDSAAQLKGKEAAADPAGPTEITKPVPKVAAAAPGSGKAPHAAVASAFVRPGSRASLLQGSKMESSTSLSSSTSASSCHMSHPTPQMPLFPGPLRSASVSTPDLQYSSMSSLSSVRSGSVPPLPSTMQLPYGYPFPYPEWQYMHPSMLPFPMRMTMEDMRNMSVSHSSMNPANAPHGNGMNVPPGNGMPVSRPSNQDFSQHRC